MTNIYWPVYKNLEAEFTKITYAIHIDDAQLNVYSSSISDLILRASAEIESLSKELYKSNGGPKTQKIKYDTDALDHLNDLWKLDKKLVIISSINCHQANKRLIPFDKSETSTFHGNMTYPWNNSYQNLKHDRANSLRFGSVKYLLDIMSALFMLNIYYKDEAFPLEKDSKALDFPINVGSDIFSVKLHKLRGYDGQYRYLKQEDFDECLYLTKYTNESLDKSRKATEDLMKQQHELFFKHPKFHNYLMSNNIQEYKGNNLMWDVLGKDDYLNLFRAASGDYQQALKTIEYEAVSNKHPSRDV